MRGGELPRASHMGEGTREEGRRDKHQQEGGRKGGREGRRARLTVGKS